MPVYPNMPFLGAAVGGMSIIFFAFVILRVYALICTLKNHQYGWLILLIIFYQIPLVDLIYIFAFQKKMDVTPQQWGEQKIQQLKSLVENKSDKKDDQNKPSNSEKDTTH